MEGTIRQFNLEGEGWKGKTEVVRGASFISGFAIDEITQIGWFRYITEEIVTIIDLILYCMRCSTLSQ